jgi:hypothetical protein
MARFDFRRRLKGLNIQSLVDLKAYHVDLMLKFIGYDDNESSKQMRYIGYIDDAIEKLKK